MYSRHNTFANGVEPRSNKSPFLLRVGDGGGNRFGASSNDHVFHGVICIMHVPS